VAELGHYDEAVATQAASLLKAAAGTCAPRPWRVSWQGSTEPVRRGFAAFAATLPEK
jgi:hypothetical protein